MTREEIEEFSGVELNRFETDREEDWYRIGCIDGLKAADAEPNLAIFWHDANEEPQYKDKCILVYSEYFDYSFTDFPNYLMMKDGGQNKDWGTVVFRNKISKWAYVSDLFPNQFRKSEQLKGGEK